MISEDGPALPYGFGCDCALIGMQPATGKAFCHFSIGALRHQFIGRRAPPEVHPGNLEEIPRNSAEKLDQCAAITPFPRLRSNSEQQLLKVLVRPWRTTDSLGYDRAAN